LGVYGDGQFDPKVGYPYCALVYNCAQLWAMYCLLVFYHNFHKQLKPYRPFPKFLAIKLVVFLSFWQSVVIAGAVSDKIIRAPVDSLYTDAEVSEGLQDLIICIEMFLAAWLHIFAFSHQDYKRDGAEKLTICGMIKTIFDVKDVAVDLKYHAKAHANAIKRIKAEHSKGDRSETEMSSPEPSESAAAGYTTLVAANSQDGASSSTAATPRDEGTVLGSANV